MKPFIWVTVGSTESADDGWNWNHIEVWATRRDAERDAVDYCRRHAAGRLVRIGSGDWIKHQPIGSDDDAEPTAYATVRRRTVRREQG